MAIDVIKDENFDFEIPKNNGIYNAFVKCKSVLDKHTNIKVSVSGGADSDIMIDMIEKCKAPHNNIHYVWWNTGLEYQATKEHFEYLEQKYGITIERIKPKYTIPAAIKKFGQPFVSKRASDYISRLQRHKFEWEEGDLNELLNKYGKVKTALSWWLNAYGEDSQFNIKKRSWLKEFMLENKPNFNISSKCCDYVKKNTSHEYIKEHNIDLDCYGVRKAEGGVRATGHKNCYTACTPDEIASFRPIFYISDADKKVYNKFYNIKNSRCYTEYGLRRTGCVGCPFAKDFRDELEVVDKFEPKLGVAVRNIFKDAYEYQNKYFDYVEEKNKQYGNYKAFLRLQKEQEENNGEK